MEQLHSWYSIVLTMMVTPRGSYRDYWKKSSYNTLQGCDFIKARMSFYIWMEITQCITTEIETLVDTAQTTWQQFWVPFLKCCCR